MRVSRIRITNIMGLEELEIVEPGALTVIEARNGRGKTSALEAIRSVIDGGTDATLLRNGAEEGEVVLVLDDETVIRKRITAKGATLTVNRPDVGSVGAPKKYVDALFNALSVNPIAFISLPEKEQARAFLEAIPLELDRGEVEAAVAGLVDVRTSDFNAHALDTLDALHKRIFEERTGVNREAKSKRATIEQLSASLPEDAPEGEGDIVTLEEQRGDLSSALDGKVREIQQAKAEQLDAVRAATEAKIEEIHAKAEAEREKIRDAADAEIRAVEDGASPELDRLTDAIIVARERLKTQAAAANTRQVVAGFTEECEALTARSQGLTEALARLDTLKLSLATRLPIKGVEVRDGVLFKGDVPFRRLNKAEQVKVAIRLAQIRAGEVPLVCVDGIEALDGETFEAFKRNAAEAGLQFIVTRVTPEQDAPDGLGVERVGELAHA